MTRREQFVLMFIASAIFVGAISLLVYHNRTSQPDAPVLIQPEPEAASPVSPDTVEPPEIVVSIQGAVRDPGVYSVAPGDRVNDLIEMAGGLALDAETASINLAAHLVDGTTLTIPSRNDPERESAMASTTVPNPAAYRLESNPAIVDAVPSQAGASAAGAVRVNLNRASRAELESLPGIGPTYAQRIIEYRQQTPFRDVSELMNINGIGTKRFEDLRDRVSIQ